MGNKGHKGAIGLGGNITYPDWVLEIIDFRNKQYQIDIDSMEYWSAETGHDVTDKLYDPIDNAISKMMSLYENR